MARTAQPENEAASYHVAPRPGGVFVEGLSPAEAALALHLLQASRRVQHERGSTAAEGLLRTMTEARVELSAPAPVQQALRLADTRRALLSTPAYTHDTLTQVHGDALPSTTRKRVERLRSRREIFTVQHNGRTVIPAFQLTESGDPRPELATILRTLVDSGVEGWALWTWLTSATPLLSGGVPEEVATVDRPRAERAAARFAARGLASA